MRNFINDLVCLVLKTNFLQKKPQNGFFQSNGLPLRLYNYKSWMQTKQKGMLQLENNFWLTSSTIIFKYSLPKLLL